MSMKRKHIGTAIGLSAVSAFLLTAWTVSAGEAELEKRTKEIVSLISGSPQVPSEIFAADFLAAVPPEKLAFTCKGIFEKTGAVTDVRVTSAAEWKREMVFVTEKGMEMPVNLHLETAAPHKIDGLWFGQARPAVKSLAEIEEKLKGLSGTTALSLWRLKDGGGHVPLMEHNPDAALAIGSTFKLYILGALLEEIAAEKLTWKHIARVRPHRKSWPSGILHEWPDGAPLTLHSLASLMISRSDNTATDVLLFTLGRKRVEAMLSLMGNEHLERTIPFLGTREMFILRSAVNTELKKKYLALDKPGRRAFPA